MLVLGTGTEVGKTWVASRLADRLRADGLVVSARKPAQSFASGDPVDSTDAAILGRATGEPPEVVCPPPRWYPLAMAPPMAAQTLGRKPILLADLAEEVRWSAGTDVGIVETAGGLCSPQAEDGDALDLARMLVPDVILLVTDAGLGVINAVRLCVHALFGSGASLAPPTIALNRFAPTVDLHRANRTWLAEREGLTTVTLPGDVGQLAETVLASTRQVRQAPLWA